MYSASVGEPLDTFHQDATVPAAIENREAACPRQVTPESPQVVMCALLVSRRSDRNHLVVTSIEASCHATDRATLAGGVPSLEDENG